MADGIPLVVSEIIEDGGLTTGQIAELLPSYRGDAEHADKVTVFRHITKGARDRSGRIVKLEAARFGGMWLTSKAALARFMARLTGATEEVSGNSESTAKNKPRPASQRAKAAEAAGRRLAAAGA